MRDDNNNYNNNNKIKQDDLRGGVHADDNDNNKGNNKKSSKTEDILSSKSSSYSSYNYSRVDVVKHEDNEADDDGKIKRSSVFFNLNQLRLPLPSIPNNIRNRALSKKNTNNKNSPTSSESNINISQQTNSNPANNNLITKKRDKIPLPLMNMELGLNGDWVIASGSYVLKPKLIKGYLPKGIVHFIGRSICHHDHQYITILTIINISLSSFIITIIIIMSIIIINHHHHHRHHRHHHYHCYHYDPS
jgi:hypothetical protein